MPTRRTKRRAPRDAKPRPSPKPEPAAAPMSARTVHLTGPPTGHAVCKGCGRIVRLELVPADGANLEAFADRRPAGWSAEGVSLTVTGVCPNCQQGTTSR